MKKINGFLKKTAYRSSRSNNVLSQTTGLLDGLTLFRFAHMSRDSSSGGVESYLWNLNRSLLERNSMRILQMYLISENETPNIEVEKLGQGELIWIPSIIKTTHEMQPSKLTCLWTKLSSRLGFTVSVNHDILFSSLAEYQPHLGVFHWITYDSHSVIDFFDSRNIPIIVVHHFHNKKLNESVVKKQISKAKIVAGVSEADLPCFLRDRFVNVADGIDVEYFQPQAAEHFKTKIEDPIIFLPARICETKGHLDAVKALGILNRIGIKASLIFAGREENQNFITKLKDLIDVEGVKNRVFFIGELNQVDLRNWYAASDVVILPTYHAEGLPRVLLEAQAMGKPVIAYNSGGSREAFLERVSGALLERGDINSLASQIRLILEERNNDRTMSHKRREFIVENFSLDSLILRHESLYSNQLMS